jgi:hypothetical protein
MRPFRKASSFSINRLIQKVFAGGVLLTASQAYSQPSMTEGGSIQPIIPIPSSYQCFMEMRGRELSTLVLFRRTTQNNVRLVAMADVGMKLFDLESDSQNRIKFNYRLKKPGMKKLFELMAKAFVVLTDVPAPLTPGEKTSGGPIKIPYVGKETRSYQLDSSHAKVIRITTEVRGQIQVEASVFRNDSIGRDSIAVKVQKLGLNIGLKPILLE